MPAIAPAAKFATKGRASSRYQSHDNTKLWDYYNLRLGLCSWAILIGIQQSTDKSMKRNQCQWSCQCQLERSLRRGLHIGVLWRQGGSQGHCQLRYEILWQHCHGPSLLRYYLPPRWTSMVYIHSWQEFQDAAEALYSKSPNDVCFITFEKKKSDQSSILQTRYCVKWRSSQGKLVLKITDNTTVSSAKILIPLCL